MGGFAAHLDSSDTMWLMHNNFHPLPDGTRIFTKGYHLQAKKATAYCVFTVISCHTYEGHMGRCFGGDKQLCSCTKNQRTLVCGKR